MSDVVDIDLEAALSEMREFPAVQVWIRSVQEELRAIKRAHKHHTHSYVDSASGERYRPDTYESNDY